MTTEPGAEVQSQRRPTRRQSMKARDIVGIVMGALLLLFGLLALSYYKDILREHPEYVLLAGVLLSVPSAFRFRARSMRTRPSALSASLL